MILKFNTLFLEAKMEISFIYKHVVTVKLFSEIELQ